MNVSIKTTRVYSRTRTEDVSEVIRVDFEISRLILKLKNEIRSSQFMWQDWVDTALGIMKGLGLGKMNDDRRIKRADLREPLVKMSPLPDKNSRELGERTGIVYVWMSWPSFDMRVSKFEMDQCFIANINNLQDRIYNDRAFD